MNSRLDRRQFLSSAASALGAVIPSPRLRGADPVRTGMVIGQPQAAEAGNAVLSAGGNAADAAVAAAFAAAVVAVPGTGLGGYGGHAVVARPDGTVSAIDFNTVAPSSFKPDAYDVDEKGNVKGEINSYGWQAVGVPGVPAGLQRLYDQFGSRPFATLVKPAARYARDGFKVDKTFANAIKASRERLSRDPGTAKVLFARGEPLAEGSIYRNTDLADLLDTFANRGGVATFYKGDVADRIAAAFRKNGGLVTTEDLAAYRALDVKPLALDYQGCTVCSPPPTAGGLTALEALSILQSLGWKGDDRDPDALNMRIEALRIAWNDRLRWLGDPARVKAPVERLLSAEYAKESADRIRAAVKAHKPLEGRTDGRPSGGTIHISAIDSRGMAVAVTLTHGSYFGAQVTIEGLGLLLGHGMSRFDPRPGRANSPEAGKRPLHNMCPTVVLRSGKPILALGATGGRRIVNSLFDVLAYRLGGGMSLSEAVNAPRIHNEGDLTLTLEAAWPASTRERLAADGYAIKTAPLAFVSAIERDPATGEVQGRSR